MKNLLTKSLSFAFVFFLMNSLTFAIEKNSEQLLSEDQLPYLLNGSNAGTLYYITFHPCWEETGKNNAIRIYVSSSVKTQVTLEIKDIGLVRTKETIPNDIIEFVLMPVEAQPYSKGSGGLPIPPRPEQNWSGRAIKISSEAPIVVYGVTRYQYTSDGFLALPVTSLGKEYQVASYADPTNNNAQYLPSYTSIVGVYNNTEVSFTLGGCDHCMVPKQNGDTLKPGETITRVLNEGDVWLIPGIGPYNDLTGSKIKADKPVAVISGNFCAYIPTHIAACDYIIEQELPEDTWGNKIYVSPIVSRMKSSIIKIFAKYANTNVSVDGVPMWKILTPGGILGVGYIESRANVDNMPKPVIIQSPIGMPINVVQYNPGQQDDNVASDPFQLQLTPFEQFQKEIVFNTPGIRGGFGFSSNYINIIYKATKDKKIPDHFLFAEVLDGKFTWIPLNKYSENPGLPFSADSADKDGRIHYVKTLKLPYDGVYRIKSDEPFAAYAYGFSAYDSYGFPTSIAVAAIDKNDTLAPKITKIEQTIEGELIGEIVDYPINDPNNRSNLSLIFMDPTTSENFKFSTEKYIANEDHIVKWKLTKIDLEEVSKARLVINDRNGNRFDTVITMKAFVPDYRRIDSLVLVSIYNKNNGKNWKNKENWLTNKPIDEWYGVKLNSNRVTELDLSNNGLTDTLSIDLTKLSKLESLNLMNNTEIILPRYSNILRDLKYLNLSNCNLYQFPSFLLHSLDIIEIDLSDNKISSLQSGLAEFKSLKKINLSNNKLDFSDLKNYKDMIDSPNLSFIYYPQGKVGIVINAGIDSGDDYVINLQLNNTQNNIYSWYHNDKFLENQNSILLTIKNFDKENIGKYLVHIKNDEFPLLTLVSNECNLFINTKKPTIITNSIYDITENSAKVEVTIKNTGGLDITEKGICWNTEGNPTITDNKKVYEGNTKQFVAILDSLLPNKEYFFRAFAINEKGLAYSEEKYFKTSVTSVEDDLPNGIKFIKNETSIVIAIQEIQNIEYKLMDLNGNILLIGSNQNRKEIIINTTKLSKGVYFIELQGANILTTKKLIID